MKSYYEIAQILKLNPVIYLGKFSLKRFETFCQGYMFYQCEENGDKYIPFYPEFDKFVQIHYGVDDLHQWPEIIHFFVPDPKEAFETFYRLLAEFCRT